MKYKILGNFQKLNNKAVTNYWYEYSALEMLFKLIEFFTVNETNSILTVPRQSSNISSHINRMKIRGLIKVRDEATE